MAQVKKGNRVKVFYTGKFNDGTVFESNIGKAPLEFSVGKGKVIKGFETAVVGMTVGQLKTVTFKPAEGYGQKDPGLVWRVAASELPADTNLAAGQEIAFSRPDGIRVEGRITDIEGDEAVVDGNHPLAGRSLTFEIKLAGMS
jgi:FKBP-type peptidyl-prolyl cis-trans isomerase 2